MRDELKLVIRGQVYRGFESISVTRTLEAAAGSFSTTVNTKKPWPILPGDELTLFLGTQQVARGFVDKVAPELAESGRRIQVEGRDRTAELVDCSADLELGSEWDRSPLEQIVGDLCGPFGIQVVNELPAIEPFPLFSLQPGETAWEAIERACRLRGILAFANGAGNLVLTRPTRTREDELLREGFNIKAASASLDYSERFNEIIVRGQQFGTDEAYGEQAAQLEGKAFDPAIRLQRRLVILAEGGVSDGSAQLRAQWEATTRAARSTKVTIELQGWSQRSGKLWAPNQLVPVDVPSLELAGDLLVSSVTFGLSDVEGSTTRLELMRPDAFTPQPIVEEEQDPFRELVEADE